MNPNRRMHIKVPFFELYEYSKRERWFAYFLNIPEGFLVLMYNFRTFYRQESPNITKYVRYIVRNFFWDMQIITDWVFHL